MQERLAILLILVVALFLRLYQITAVPGGISGDELFNAIDAWRVGKEHWPLFFEGNNGREALFLYTMAASLRLLGQTIFAIRLSAVSFGMGSVFLTWRIGRTQFNRRIGLLAAALMSVSLWPVMESRWGLRAISLTFFTAVTLHLLDRGFRRQKRELWVLGGIMLGLTMYTYLPSRAFPVVVLVWLGWLFWVKRDQFLTQWRNIALSLLMGMIIFAPFAVYIIRYPDKINQRVDTLTVALDVTRETGDIIPLVESVSGVLKMFSVYGDKEWRYHVSGDPLFDPLTSLFFYIGLVVCIWQAFSSKGGGDERPSYAMLLLWLGAMLLPNAIIGANSSFLRAAGAMVPIYLLVAIGLDKLVIWLHGRFPKIIRRQLVSAVILIGLILTAANTWQRYFNLWNNQDDVRRIYQSDMAEIGRFLNENPAPPGTRVFLADSYVVDLAPKTFAYYSDHPVDWFDAGHSFALGQGEPIWVLNAVNEPLPPELLDSLPPNTAIATHTFPNGEPAFTLYKFPSGATGWSATHTQSVDFVDGPQLVGYDAVGELFRGDNAPILLHFRILPDRTHLPNSLTFAQVSLEDRQGNVWAKNSVLLGYPQASWHGEDEFVQLVPLQIPEGMPPGTAVLRFDLHDSDGRLNPIAGVTTPDSDVNRSAAVTIRSHPLTDYQPASDTSIFAGEIALESATLSTQLTPGMALDVSLDWVALERPSADYRVQFQFIQPQAHTPILTQTFKIWPDVYPPSQWQSGEQVSSSHRLIIPLDLPTDVNPELHIQLLHEDKALPLNQGAAKLADMSLVLRDHTFAVPAISHPTQAQFGDNIQLLGYDLDMSESHPGGRIQLTLLWQALETPSAHYTIFNHILAADGQMQGQLDAPPSGDAWLTGTWLPGEVILDEREIGIRGEAVSGRYPLIVGLYNASDGERLPVLVNGEPQPGDQLLLTEVEIGN
ncbi:MAG: glycosyltransferase family 39 protein [Chloroflexi bacterium]|nr:glycosyltransferase family 39 protein [Chloroflexota bacterium]